MRRLFGRFRRLQWKLTATYTCFTSIVAVLALFGIFAILWGLFTSPVTLSLASRLLVSGISDEIAPMVNDSERQDELQLWLADKSRILSDSIVDDTGEPVVPSDTLITDQVLVVNDALQVAAALPQELIETSEFTEGERELIRGLIDGTDTDFLYPVQRASNSDGTHIDSIFIPIRQAGRVEGVMVVRLENPLILPGVFPTVVTALLIPLSLPVLCLASLIGLPFGFLATRGLSRRLRKLSDSADSWAEGDFSVVVNDTSGDEIGQLGRQLNSMATELDTLIHSRSQLATVEERNRIARDLHDSAKQQIFATTMQLSVAKSLMDTNPEQAKLHMVEAEQLAKAVQKELSGLIEELRPAQLEGTGLYGAVRSAIQTFKRQSGISAEVRTQGERELPITVEQPLFRILQESLNNISKHSQAKNVDIHLVATPDTITMTIHDDGIGFSQDDAAKGGLGLRSMQERITQLNGSLRVTSNPETGTTVRAECPFNL